MNRTLATLILTFSATFGVTTLNAQDKAIANIPFDFQVKSKTMPAGKYEIRQPSRGDAVLFAMSDNNGHALFVGAPERSRANPEDSKLTFACYAGKCSLASISMPGSSVAYSLKSNTTHNVGMASMIAVRVTH